MNCENIKNLSLAYFEEDMKSEQRQMVENHLQSCQSCSEFYLFTKMNFVEIEKSKRKENDPYFYSALMAKIENQNAPSTVLSRQPMLRLSLISLVLVFSVFSGLFIGNYSAEVLNSTADITETTTVEQLGFDLANNEIDIFNNLTTNDNE
jgi:predicted anti-sigma-YlaC factor YlaD